MYWIRKENDKIYKFFYTDKFQDWIIMEQF